MILPLLELLTDVPTRACGDVSPFVYGGVTYSPFGTLGSVGEITRTSRVEINEWNLGVMVHKEGNEENYAGFQAAVQSTIANTDVSGKQVNYSFAILDPDRGTVIGVRQKKSGFGSHLQVEIEPGRTLLALQCEPLIGGGLGPRAAFLTGEDQKLRYPGDKGLDFASRQSGSLAITWDPVA